MNGGYRAIVSSICLKSIEDYTKMKRVVIIAKGEVQRV
ncbi:hypothetical protein C5S53_05565 [Methanophagales archaeon]|nr:hypothetical protein C5S53_05565 [Methanophagales archaeon]